MAQLKDTVVQGSLRVTDTAFTTNLNISSVTASKAILADENKNLISGTVPINSGGTGLTSSPSMLTNLATTAAANVLQASPRPGVTGTLPVGNGGTNITSYTIGDILYASATATLSKLTGNTTVTRKFLRSVATTAGTAVAPAWDTVTKTDVGLSNVTNDAQVKASLGTAKGDMLYWSAASTPARLAIGTANHVLIASANGPVWAIAAALASATSTTANTAAYTDLTLGNNANVSTTTAHSEGRIYLYSAATHYHAIVGASTTANYTHTLPNNTGTLVSLSGGTVKGSATKPVYIPATGIVTECNTYAGGTSITLNNASKASTTASIYAPTTGGAAGYPLIGAGTTAAPAWYSGLTLTGTAAATWAATFSGTAASTSTSTGAVKVSGGVGVGGQLTATRVGAGGSNTSYTLYANGSTYLNGATTLNGNIIGSANNNYGETLPTTGLTAGRIFFQTVDTEYELPPGGNQGALLVKRSADDRDIEWSNTVASLTANTTIVAGTNISAGGNLNISGNITAGGNITGSQVFNAVWNDYAECRSSWVEEPGRVIIETASGTMELATERLMAGCKIISDTYGSLMGESKTARVPIAVAGRVLAYPYQDRKLYELGAAVCSGPNGTVDIMTREEIREYPERILGTVSEIPDYKIWQAGNEENPTSIKVNGRIWIYVR